MAIIESNWWLWLFISSSLFTLFESYQIFIQCIKTKNCKTRIVWSWYLGIKKAISKVITTENAKKWFAHSQRYFRQCAMGIPFNGKILDSDFIPPFQTQKQTNNITVPMLNNNNV